MRAVPRSTSTLTCINVPSHGFWSAGACKNWPQWPSAWIECKAVLACHSAKCANDKILLSLARRFYLTQEIKLGLLISACTTRTTFTTGPFWGQQGWIYTACPAGAGAPRMDSRVHRMKSCSALLVQPMPSLRSTRAEVMSRTPVPEAASWIIDCRRWLHLGNQSMMTTCLRRLILMTCDDEEPTFVHVCMLRRNAEEQQYLGTVCAGRAW